MFTLTETEVAAIQAAYHAGGETAAADELRSSIPMRGQQMIVAPSILAPLQVH